ncbi:MAG TPA: hypothetical protein VKN99_20730 [Polyangia bacterium]|nr:hypothetical protein [Polyangia bacterium]
MLALCAAVLQATLPSYFWLEAERMEGVSGHWPSWSDERPAPGWHWNGPGVSAEWGQGGESSFNSIACGREASPGGRASERVLLPHAGRWRLWVRYAEWRDGVSPMDVSVGPARGPALRGVVGDQATLDPQDEALSYWGWTFVWGSLEGTLAAGPAQIVLSCQRAAAARRIADVVVLTDDLSWRPQGRERPRFGYLRALEDFWARAAAVPPGAVPTPLPLGTHSFELPWNLTSESFEPGLPPFAVEPKLRAAFVAAYRDREVPIFSSKLVVPVVALNDLPRLLARLQSASSPFYVLINYQDAPWRKNEPQRAQVAAGRRALAARDRGDISGESIGYPWDLDDKTLDAAIARARSRADVLERIRQAYEAALRRKRAQLYGGADSPWPPLIPALSSGAQGFAHALAAWGVRTLGLETAAGMPCFASRIAFVRGAARQYHGGFLYYHAPNFGDTASTFTHLQNLAGPGAWFHTRYGLQTGPSIAWYRKSLFLEWLAGAQAIYYEQGFDQFFQPGPGAHPVQLNPLGRVTSELVRMIEQHPERGLPVAPVALLLDPAHGWDAVDYVPQAFGREGTHASLRPSDADRSIAQTIDVLFYPNALVQGEPATAERQAFVHAALGDGVDVLVASAGAPVSAYPVIVLAGRVAVPPPLVQALEQHVAGSGRLVLARGSAPALERLCGRPRVTCVDAPLGLAADGSAAPAWALAVAEAAWAAAPAHVVGDVEWLVNRTPHGYLVALLNSRGNDKPQQGLAIAPHRDQFAEVTLRVRAARSAREWFTQAPLPVKDGTLPVRVPAGAIRIVELMVE